MLALMIEPWPNQQHLWTVFFTAMALGASTGCRRDDSNATPAPVPATALVQPENVLVFPDELRTADESVNNFIRHSMSVCAAGNYEDFRLIWSAKEEPLPRAEYEQGWQAVREIRIRALREVRMADHAGTAAPPPDPQYAVYADVYLDPELLAAQQEPRRSIISLIVRESDGWKLSRAPKALREWLTEQVAASEQAPRAEPGPPTGNP